VTERFGFDPDRLWITVHLDDDEAADIWRDVVGIAPERIQRLDKDNFWQAGDTGPCGPCSEIFIDKGPAYGPEGGPAQGGEERYLEFWNLVFMQYDQQPDGSRLPLPKPSIDTGAGLERVLVARHDLDSVFDIDEFQALLEVAQSASGKVYGRDAATDVSLRILVEHARATSFLVSDGVFPSNEGRGYVLRRILRRAVRHAYLLGLDSLIMPTLVDGVVDVMGDSYPELVRSHDFVRGVIGREEERFRQTLKTGSVLLEDRLAELSGGPNVGAGVPTVLDGITAFTLHDTYGFPLEVTQEITAEAGIEVDVAGFETAMAEQRARAKAARKGVTADEHFDDYQELLEQFGPTEYLARGSETETTARVLARVGRYLVLDRTPFYAEAGGQVGDTGWIRSATGEVRVLNTTLALPGLVRHEIEPGGDGVQPGQEVTAAVDNDRRDAIRRNHTGTHLLHYALRKVLGEHVRQQGSYVAPERLRFDFSHYEPVTPTQMAEIEDIVAGEVLTNAPVRAFETTKAHADELGALAFFGDKYGDIVRVVEAGPSVELCGGTHVRRLGDIGTVKVVGEGSIGSNIRRIEAITGFDTLVRLRDTEARLREAADRVNVPVEELLDGIDRRLGELKAAQAELKTLRRQLSAGRADELVAAARDGAVVARVDGMNRDDLRTLALEVRNKGSLDAVVLAGEADGGGVAMVAAVRKDGGRNAGELIADATREIKGGGGRGDELAMAGGKEVAGIDAALDLVRAAIAAPVGG
jgi:alanyl-tRNA synthetase